MLCLKVVIPFHNYKSRNKWYISGVAWRGGHTVRKKSCFLKFFFFADLIQNVQKLYFYKYTCVSKKSMTID